MFTVVDSGPQSPHFYLRKVRNVPSSRQTFRVGPYWTYSDITNSWVVRGPSVCPEINIVRQIINIVDLIHPGLIPKYLFHWLRTLQPVRIFFLFPKIEVMSVDSRQIPTFWTEFTRTDTDLLLPLTCSLHHRHDLKWTPDTKTFVTDNPSDGGMTQRSFRLVFLVWDHIRILLGKSKKGYLRSSERLLREQMDEDTSSSGRRKRDYTRTRGNYWEEG